MCQEDNTLNGSTRVNKLGRSHVARGASPALRYITCQVHFVASATLNCTIVIRVVSYS